MGLDPGGTSRVRFKRNWELVGLDPGGTSRAGSSRN